MAERRAKVRAPEQPLHTEGLEQRFHIAPGLRVWEVVRGGGEGVEP